MLRRINNHQHQGDNDVVDVPGEKSLMKCINPNLIVKLLLRLLYFDLIDLELAISGVMTELELSL